MADIPRIDTYEVPMVMAEIGCNHMGEIDIAKELLDLAKRCGCNFAKFKSAIPKKFSRLNNIAVHPGASQFFWFNVRRTPRVLGFSLEQHQRSQAHANSIGLGYSCSVWDITSAREIVSLQPDLIKVGSPSNMHWEMMKILRGEYEGGVHISTE